MAEGVAILLGWMVLRQAEQVAVAALAAEILSFGYAGNCRQVGGCNGYTWALPPANAFQSAGIQKR